MLSSLWEQPAEVQAEIFSALPESYRQLGQSEHSRNQKRGRPLDSFLEGPLVRNGILYLTDIPYGRIFGLDLSTKEWNLVVQYDGEPNGLAWHENRQKILIADFKCGILELDLNNGQITTLMDRFNGERLKGPNDLVVARDGAIIFTDQGMSGLQDPSGRVYRIGTDGRVDVLLRNCPSPNGLVLDVSQTSLFVAMTRDNSIWLAPLYPDGSVQRTGRFASYFGVGGPDGMATDCEGNIFVAHSTLGTIFVHRKDGTLRTRILTGHVGQGTTNLTWGGDDGRLLYIVESESGSILTVTWHCAGVL